MIETTTLYERISIDTLTVDGVNVKKQPYIISGDVEYIAGSVVGVVYKNSEEGRASIKNDLPEQYAKAIIAVWGEEPTVFEEDLYGTDN